MSVAKPRPSDRDLTHSIARQQIKALMVVVAEDHVVTVGDLAARLEFMIMAATVAEAEGQWQRTAGNMVIEGAEIDDLDRIIAIRFR